MFFWVAFCSNREMNFTTSMEAVDIGGVAPPYQNGAGLEKSKGFRLLFVAHIPVTAILKIPVELL